METAKTETASKTNNTAGATTNAAAKNPMYSFAESAFAEYEKGVDQLIEHAAAQSAEAFRTARAFQSSLIAAMRAGLDTSLAMGASIQSAGESAMRSAQRGA